MNRYVKLILVAAIVGIGIFALRPETHPVSLPAQYADMTLIAHAGGGLPEGTYSNAQEALDQSAASGFTLIEIDLSPTEDGDLVLIHDWDKTHYRYFSKFSLAPKLWQMSFPQPAKSADAFKARTMKAGLTSMSLDDLIVWMRANPNVKIITDIKDGNLENLAIVKTRAGDMTRNIIPQIYAPAEYAPVKAMGYEDIIFTNYRARLPTQDMLSFAKDNPVLGLTVPVESVTPQMIEGAAQHRTPIYVHKFLSSTSTELVNSPEGAQSLKARGIAGVYTDYLYPGMTP